jgi:hypothetical protein
MAIPAYQPWFERNRAPEIPESRVTLPTDCPFIAGRY